MKIKKFDLVMLIIISGFILSYSNCGGFKSATSLSSGGNNGTLFPGGGTAGNPSSTDIVPVAGVAAITAATPHFAQVIENLKNITCVTNPSQNLRLQANGMKAIFSQDGLASSLSQTVQAVNLGIAALYCEEAFNREASLAAGSRCLYKSVNYSAGPEQFTAGTLQSLSTDISSRFWSRSPSSDESSIMVSGLTDILNNSTQSGSGKVKELAITSCIMAFNSASGLLM